MAPNLHVWSSRHGCGRDCLPQLDSYHRLQGPSA